MLRKVLSLLFFIGFLVNGSLIAQTCGGSEIVDIGGADGSFAGCASKVLSPLLNSDVTCGGWSNGNGSADSHDNNNSMSLSPSPDGGVFAALFYSTTLSGPFTESFYTDIDNLTVGKVYTLKFYFVNTGMYNTNPSADVKAKVTFGTEVKETSVYPFEGYGSQVWDEVTMNFTASSTTQRLTFESVAVSNNLGYMGIDGVRLTTTSDTGNNGPVANDDGNIVNEGELTVGNVFDNDTDADGDLLQIVSIIKLPDHGSLTSNSLSLIHI